MLNRRSVLQLSGGAVVAGLTASRWNQALAQAGVVPRGLIVHRPQPLNAEPPLARLRAAFITLQPDFYVRSHGTIPKLTREGYKLRIGGASVTSMELSLDGLQSRFPRRTVTAVLQCAGNQRADMLAVKPVPGDPARSATRSGRAYCSATCCGPPG